MTDEELNEIERVTLTSSDCGWYAEVATEEGDEDPCTDPDRLAEGFRRHLANDPAGRPCWCVGVKDTPLSAPAIAAWTGNGPTSEANAKFFGGARRVILALVEELRKTRQERDRLADTVRVMMTKRTDATRLLPMGCEAWREIGHALREWREDEISMGRLRELIVEALVTVKAEEATNAADEANEKEAKT